MENPTFKNEKIELLVCINEILGELVFKYGISGCSRCLTLETIMNPPPSQIQLRQLFPSDLNHVSLYKLFVKGVSTLQCREYFLDGDCITLPLFGITLRMENLHWRYICNRKLQVVVFCYHPTKKGTENGANIVNIYWKHVWNKLKYWNHSLSRGKGRPWLPNSLFF